MFRKVGWLWMIFSVVATAGCSTTEAFVNEGATIGDKTEFVILRGNDPRQLSDVIASELRKTGYKASIRYDNSSRAVGDEARQEAPSRSTGTGFFVSEDGIVLTNAHVVDQASELAVLLRDGRNEAAELLSIDRLNDIAVLRVPTVRGQVKALSLGTSDDLDLGDPIHVIGYPLSSIIGTEPRVTQGIVSAKTGIQDSPNHFQISASIQPGNSGGPVLDKDFRVVGIATYRLNDLAVAQRTGSLPQNVNFAVDIDYASLLLREFPSESDQSPESLSEAASSTVLVIAGPVAPDSTSSPQSADSALKEILVNFGYEAYWDAIHYTLRYLTIDFVDASSGDVIATASFRGASIGSADGITRNVVREALERFEQ
jgi:hypothetical protein